MIRSGYATVVQIASGSVTVKIYRSRIIMGEISSELLLHTQAAPSAYVPSAGVLLPPYLEAISLHSSFNRIFYVTLSIKKLWSRETGRQPWMTSMRIRSWKEKVAATFNALYRNTSDDTMKNLCRLSGWSQNGYLKNTSWNRLPKVSASWHSKHRQTYNSVLLDAIFTVCLFLPLMFM
jgi:hypothetical protein